VIESLNVPSWIWAIKVGKWVNMTPQSSQRHVTASGSAFLADLSLSPAAGEPLGEQLYDPANGSLRADSSSSFEDSENEGEIERGEREGL
jgi:hypothetical protein